jgi:hypothetical protein
MASWREASEDYFDTNTGRRFMTDYGVEVLNDDGERLFFLSDQWDYNIAVDAIAESLVEQLNSRAPEDSQSPL